VPETSASLLPGYRNIGWKVTVNETGEPVLTSIGRMKNYTASGTSQFSRSRSETVTDRETAADIPFSFSPKVIHGGRGSDSVLNSEEGMLRDYAINHESERRSVSAGESGYETDDASYTRRMTELYENDKRMLAKESSEQGNPATPEGKDNGKKVKLVFNDLYDELINRLKNNI
jgi:hypothetical protein